MASNIMFNNKNREIVRIVFRSNHHSEIYGHKSDDIVGLLLHHIFLFPPLIKLMTHVLLFLVIALLVLFPRLLKGWVNQHKTSPLHATGDHCK